MTANENEFDERTWDVRNIPHWGEHWVDEVDYRSIDSAHFFSAYADRWKPVIIRGACRDWKAFQEWTNDYLLEKWGDAKVSIYTAPSPQGGHPATQATRSKAWFEGTFSDLINTSEKNWSIRAFTIGAGSPLDGMVADLDDRWPAAKPAPLVYARQRLFIHRGGVSLWHAHPVDDHLTYQIRGSKDFVFLSPDQTALISRMNDQELYSFGFDDAKYPEWRQIRPLCARLNAGDAIYIPPLWWHTAVPVDQTLGATLASTWGSSRRALLRHGIPAMFYKGNRSYLRYLPFLLFYCLIGWRGIFSRSKSPIR